MGLGSDIKAGSAYVEMTLNSSKFVKSLDAAASKVANFGKGLSAIGAAITGPLLGAAKIFADMGDAIDKSAARIGIGVQELQQWGFAAERTGQSMETIEKATLGLSKRINEAAKGNAKFQKTFKDIGISAKDLEGLDPGQALELVGDAIGNIESDIEKAAIATELLGGSGAKLIPLFNEGAAGMRALRKEAEELNIGLDEEEVANAAKLTDAFGDLAGQIKTLIAVIGAGLAPLLVSVIDSIKPILAFIIQWIRDNQELIKTIFLIGAGLVAFGVAAIAIAGAISALSAAVTLAASAVAALGAALAFLVSPIGLILASVVGLTTAFFTMTESGKGAAADLTSAFEEFWGKFKIIFGYIINLLTEGQLDKAAEVAMTALTATFNLGLAKLKVLWESIWSEMRLAFDTAVALIVVAASDLWTNLQSTANLIGTAFEVAFASIKGVVLSVVEYVKGQFLQLANVIGGFLGLIDDTEAAGDAIAAETARRQEEIANTEKQEINAAISAGKAEQEAINKANRSRTEAIRQELKAKKAEIEAAKQAGIKAAEEEAAAAREQLNKLIKEALAFEKELADVEDPTTKPGGGTASAAALESFGTFSLRAAQLAAGGSTIEQEQLDEAKETNKLLTSIDKKQKRGAFV
jgi:hypothetical protein